MNNLYTSLLEIFNAYEKWYLDVLFILEVYPEDAADKKKLSVEQYKKLGINGRASLFRAHNALKQAAAFLIFWYEKEVELTGSGAGYLNLFQASLRRLADQLNWLQLTFGPKVSM